MYDHSSVGQSSSGVATVDRFPTTGDKIQVNCRNIDVGTGTVTITARVGNSTSYTSIGGENTIDLTAPIGLILEGKFSGIKATSSSSSDVFELEVNS